MAGDKTTTGQCNCGDVAFAIDTKLSDVYVCHCSICRRSTGSGGIAVAVVPVESFRWTQGQDAVRYWAKPGHDWHTSFCPTCGSTLPGMNDAASMYVPVGLLTSGDDRLRVAHHLWVGSKACWEEIGGSAPQHQKAITSGDQ